MDVKLPKLGEGADSGVVVNVFVKEGDTVAKDQPLLELENEKAVASIPSTAAGVVGKVHVKAGDRVSVGQRLVTLNNGLEPAAPAAPQAAAPAPKRPSAIARQVHAPEPEPVPADEGEPEGPRSMPRWPRPRSARWRGNWASISPKSGAAKPAVGSSWAMCAPICNA